MTSQAHSRRVGIERTQAQRSPRIEKEQPYLQRFAAMLPEMMNLCLAELKKIRDERAVENGRIDSHPMERAGWKSELGSPTQGSREIAIGDLPQHPFARPETV